MQHAIAACAMHTKRVVWAKSSLVSSSAKFSGRNMAGLSAPIRKNAGVTRAEWRME
jgi:hypothetical protein